MPNIHSSQPKPQLHQRHESPIDMQEGDKEIYITMELPGLKKENIKLETFDNILTIEINDDNQPYRKEIDLKTEINEKKTEATYNNGILCITLEKLKPKKKGRKINIK
jgi:HSP20 family protein